MFEDFVRAIAENENLDTVYLRIRERIYGWRDFQIKQVDQDFEAAKLIRNGLLEPADSRAYRMAKAMLEDAQDKEKHKDEATRRREQMRQEVEEQYLRMMQERLETERKATDAARQTVIEQERLKSEIMEERSRLR